MGRGLSSLSWRLIEWKTKQNRRRRQRRRPHRHPQGVVHPRWNLDSIPDDLFGEITGRLDARTLFALRAVCRRFRALLQGPDSVHPSVIAHAFAPDGSAIRFSETAVYVVSHPSPKVVMLRRRDGPDNQILDMIDIFTNEVFDPDLRPVVEPVIDLTTVNSKKIFSHWMTAHGPAALIHHAHGESCFLFELNRALYLYQSDDEGQHVLHRLVDPIPQGNSMRPRFSDIYEFEGVGYALERITGDVYVVRGMEVQIMRFMNSVELQYRTYAYISPSKVALAIVVGLRDHEDFHVYELNSERDAFIRMTASSHITIVVKGPLCSFNLQSHDLELPQLPKYLVISEFTILGYLSNIMVRDLLVGLFLYRIDENEGLDHLFNRPFDWDALGDPDEEQEEDSEDSDGDW